MASGVLVKHSPTHPGFWYPCTRNQIREVLVQHYAHWKTKQVVVDGAEVVQTVPPESLAATYCSNYREGVRDGAREGVMDGPEPIDVAAILKG